MSNTKKTFLAGTIVASAILAATSITANANGLFRYSNLGSGESIRCSFLNEENSAHHAELKCGGKEKPADSAAVKKGKDAKCGEGKCGGTKKAPKKGKDAKCGEGKCGGDKKGKH